MTPEQAAWVRATVWPTNWLPYFETRPDTFHMCRCQYPCGWCTRAEHPVCRLRDPNPPKNSGAVGRGRETVLRFPGGASASVWLADRACRYLCDCPVCAHTTAQTRRIPAGQQLDLFGTAA